MSRSDVAFYQDPWMDFIFDKAAEAPAALRPLEPLQSKKEVTLRTYGNWALQAFNRY